MFLKKKVDNVGEKRLITNDPVVNAKAYGNYAKRLNELIDSDKYPDVLNVAVAGPHGSGKSSLVKTYISLYRKKCGIRKKEFVRVSFASFNKVDVLNDDVERSILQQILFTKRSSKLPNSGIQRVNSENRFITFARALVLLIWALSLFGTFYLLKYFDFSQASDLDNLATMIFYIFLGVCSVFTFIVLFYVLHNKPLRRIKLKDIEAVFSDNDKNKEKDLIGRFTNELLYYFEVVRADLVIFEDLDRLNDCSLLNKLRELNTTLNYSPLKKAKKIVFLYCLSEEVLEKEEERSKFFDYVLPIVPVVSANSSFNELQEMNLLVESYPVSTRCLKIMSAFLTSKRLINNAFNYYENLIPTISKTNFPSKENLSKSEFNDKFFVVCCYRALFPFDYEKLLLNEGILPELIESFKEIRERKTKELSDERIKLEDKITRIKNEYLVSFADLVSIFATNLLKTSDDLHSSNSQPTYPDIFNLKTFENFVFQSYTVTSTKFREQYYYGNTMRPFFIYTNINDGVFSKAGGFNLTEREQMLKAKYSSEINDIQNRIYELTEQVDRINSYPIKNLISDDLSDFIHVKVRGIVKGKYAKGTDDENFSDNPLFTLLIDYLATSICNGLIDTDYRLFVSGLENEKLTENDNEVYRSITANRPTDFDIHIVDSPKLLASLDDANWTARNIFKKAVFDNLTEILTSKSLSNQIKKLFGKSLPELSCRIADYSKCVSENKFLDFCNTAIDVEPNLIESLLRIGNQIGDKTPLVIKAALNLSAAKGGVFRTKLSSSMDFVIGCNDFSKTFLTKKEEDEFISILSNTKVKYHVFPTFTQSNESISDWIVNNEAYEISRDNIKAALKTREIQPGQSLSADLRKNVSTANAIQEYLEKNQNQWIDDVLLKDAEVDVDEAKMAIILNDESVSNNSKIKLIDKWKDRFEKIELIANTEVKKEIVLHHRCSLNKSSFEFCFAFIDSSEGKTLLQSIFACNRSHDFFIAKGNILPLIPVMTDGGKDILDNFLLSVHDSSLDLKDVCNLVKNNRTTADFALRLIENKKIKYLSGDFANLVNTPELATTYLSLFKDVLLCDDEFKKFFSQPLSAVANKRILGPSESSIMVDILKSESLPFELRDKIFACFGEYAAPDKCWKDVMNYAKARDLSVSWNYYQKISSLIEDRAKSMEWFNYLILNPKSHRLPETIFKELWQGFGEPYSNLFAANGRVCFPVSDQNLSITNALKKQGLIHTLKRAGNIFVYKNSK